MAALAPLARLSKPRHSDLRASFELNSRLPYRARATAMRARTRERHTSTATAPRVAATQSSALYWAQRSAAGPRLLPVCLVLALRSCQPAGTYKSFPRRDFHQQVMDLSHALWARLLRHLFERFVRRHRARAFHRETHARFFPSNRARAFHRGPHARFLSFQQQSFLAHSSCVSCSNQFATAVRANTERRTSKHRVACPDFRRPVAARLSS